MTTARNKVDLEIEVWESLDCESVGAAEIVAIEEAVRARFGDSAVDSPMSIARRLADEGAVLRHSEIMGLYVARNTDLPYEAAFRNILKINDLSAAAASLTRLENLRRKYASENDKEGLRLVRDKAREGRTLAIDRAKEKGRDQSERDRFSEIAEWLTLWNQSPEMFEAWIERRLNSQDFQSKFPNAAAGQD